jgi:hypothetical protein
MPSDVTPPVPTINTRPVDSFCEAPKAMDTPHKYAFTDGPPADVHKKEAGSTPRFSTTAGLKGLAHAVQAAKRLQQVMSDREPTPFVTPPDMPKHLADEFMEGLEEYGLDIGLEDLGLCEEQESEADEAEEVQGQEGLDALCQAAALQDRLPDALEERSSSLFVPPQTEVEVTPADNYNTQNGYHNALHQESPAPTPLFPSPSIEEKPVWAYAENALHRFAPPIDYAPREQPSFGTQFFEDVSSEPPTVSVPSIEVQSPSPRKKPSSKKRSSRKRSSKKRGPSLSGEDSFGPTLKGARAENKTTGLPVLPVDAEALWRIQFPGNTKALLSILIPWSVTMQGLYNQLPNPETFPFHPALPFPVKPPHYSRLVSASFYDTSVTPHKEIRFFGPGDAAELAYAEVHVFRSKEDLTSLEEPQKPAYKFETMKQKLILAGKKNKANRHTDEAHHAMTGEGRWAYIMVKGHPDAGTPPHMMLAWHTSAVTDASDCVHTILPADDNATLPPTPPSKAPLKHYASLQTVSSAASSQKRLHQSLRSASSSELPQVEDSSTLLPEGAQMFDRTVLKFEKAGNVSLIEGFRVDVVKFKGFMDAVGRGKGKVILWRDREYTGVNALRRS